MATHYVPVLSGMRPNATGDVFFGASDIFGPATPDPVDLLAYVQGSNKRGASVAFRVPEDYVGTAAIVVAWASSSTAGSNVVWDVDYRAVASAESFNQATNQENVSTTTADSTTAWNQVVSTLSLTSSNLVAGDVVTLTVARDQADASDTLAADVLVWGIWFKYADA